MIDKTYIQKLVHSKVLFCLDYQIYLYISNLKIDDKIWTCFLLDALHIQYETINKNFLYNHKVIDREIHLILFIHGSIWLKQRLAEKFILFNGD